MLKLMQALFAPCSAKASEEDKILSYLKNVGFDDPTASRYAKVARKNGWTIGIVDRIKNYLKNETYLKSKGIVKAFSVSPEEYDSPITVQRVSEKQYRVILFFGTNIGSIFNGKDIDGVMAHEMRHVRVILFLEEQFKKDPNASMVGIVQKEGNRMFGKAADDIYKGFFSRVNKMDFIKTAEAADDLTMLIRKLVDETLVWANATRPELDGNVFQNTVKASTVNIEATEKMDKYSEAKLIMGLTLYKLISDKQHVPINDAKYSALVDKYKNKGLFKDTYAFLGVCFDVSKVYFPK
jgi:hypothetical protein